MKSRFKKVLDWIWEPGFDILFLIVGAASIGKSIIENHNIYYLLIGLWLLTMPVIERKLKTIIQQNELIVMSQVAQAMYVRDKIIKEELGVCGCEKKETA